MKYYSAIKKSETIEFVKKKWINLESIILTQSQEEKKACLDSYLNPGLSCMCMYTCVMM